MLKSTAKKRVRFAARPAVLPKAARDYAKKIEEDPQLAAKFLIDAGIIEKPGVLTRPYR